MQLVLNPHIVESALLNYCYVNERMIKTLLFIHSLTALTLIGHSFQEQKIKSVNVLTE